MPVAVPWPLCSGAWFFVLGATIIYAHQFQSIGSCVRDLEIILESVTPEECHNHLLPVPL